MLFNSYIFAVFFGIFLVLYWLLRRRRVPQTALILLGSYFFYGWWDERFLILIIISTVTDYVVMLGLDNRRLSLRRGLAFSAYLVIVSIALMIPRWSATAWALWFVVAYVAVAWCIYPCLFRLSEGARRKALLIYILCVDLGVLGVFKYFNFFADSFAKGAAALGWNVDAVTLNIVLPVGISFYTFQTIGFCIDVYRRKTLPPKDFVQFSAYVAFFPQLVAGPIERGGHLLPQFSVPHSPTLAGGWLFLWGLYKKIVIADNLAPFVQSVFSNPSGASSAELIAAVVAFAFQIYCDFSGYSDMARGIARMLGFDILLNFNLPYLARTPSEFWARWHISLSTWLRDYLYVSLGGNRRGALLTYRNLMITMLLGGLWHGAAWTFILWGAFHGAILVVYRKLGVDAWLERRQGHAAIRRLQDVVLTGIMFCLVCAGWLLFRAGDMHTVASFVRGMNGPLSLEPFRDPLFYIAPLLAFQALQLCTKNLEPLRVLPGFIRLNIQLFILCSLLLLASSTPQEFIYFAF
ncbi:MAG: MBOAT family O-acyltransferase [Betaproteobacteria bacterium]